MTVELPVKRQVRLVFLGPFFRADGKRLVTSNMPAPLWCASTTRADALHLPAFPEMGPENPDTL